MLYRQVLTGLAMAGLLNLATPATQAAPQDSLRGGESGPVEFLSRTPSGPTEFMAGGGTPAPITGSLALPPGNGPFAAMVIMHGSGGIRPGREGAWAERLTAQGVATFIVDSFTPRGIAVTSDDQSRLPISASVADGFAALGLLATHPRIDATRIGVMGFSKGGQVALYTALESFRQAAGVGDKKFALHIGLYPSCSIPYISPVVDRSPILFLLGGMDDYTPAAHCERYADWFAQNGAGVTRIVYPGAHHGFDTPDRVQFLSRVQTARDCGFDIELEPVQGRFWNTGTVIPNAEITPQARRCATRGAHFGGDPASRDLAMAAVRDAVAQHLLHSTGP